jgi:NitT/TauT family transport system permease protein
VSALGTDLQTGGIGQTREGPVVRRSWLGERNTLRVISIVAMLAIWEIVALNVNPLFLPTPVSVAEAFVDLIAHGGLLQATWVSLQVFLIGFAVAAAAGLICGFAFGLSDVLHDLSDPWLTIFWATPSVALLPLIVIWFGLTTMSQIVIVFLSTFFPVAIETSVAVKHIDTTLLKVAKAFGATQFERLVHIVFPSAVPYVVSGLRVAVGRAVIGVIVAELFTSATGLGAKMTYYSNYFQTANYFAALVMFVIFSFALTEAVALIERRYRRSRR